jgi:hypothetical protein
LLGLRVLVDQGAEDLPSVELVAAGRLWVGDGFGGRRRGRGAGGVSAEHRDQATLLGEIRIRSVSARSPNADRLHCDCACCYSSTKSLASAKACGIRGVIGG